MRIAVLTFFHNGNFGSELQAIAMGKYLASNGHDAYFCKCAKENRVQKLLKFFARKCQDTATKLTNSEYRNAHKSLQKNAARQCPVSSRTKALVIEDSNKFNNYLVVDKKQLSSQFDVCICGSDQIWSPYIMPLKNEYYLPFVESERKIAYAPSFGVSVLPNYHKEKIRKYLSDFYYLSVREENAASMVQELIGRTPTIVLDPTMLLEPDEWNSLIDKPVEERPKEKFIFAYFLGIPDENCKKSILSIASNENIVLQPKREEKIFENQISTDMGCINFLRMIRDAEYVVTDSFHGTVFSIIFKKQFVVIPRNNTHDVKQTSRIDSLLGMLGLQNRFWDYKSNINDVMKKPINYEQVHAELEKYREQSQHFIDGSLCAIEKKRGRTFE